MRAEGGGLEEPEREGLARSLCSRTHTLTRDAINIQSPSAPAGRPAAPLLASLGTPPPAKVGGRGGPPPRPLASAFLLLGQESEGLQIKREEWGDR